MALSSSRNISIFNIFNCFLLFVVAIVLVYDIKVNSQLKKSKSEEPESRQKRSSNGDELPEWESADVKLVVGGKILSSRNMSTGGAVYTRWGRSTCDGLYTELVYAGVVGGSWFDHYGGGSNYLCMPMNPTWENFNDAVTNQAIVYGAEYELQANDFPFTSSNANKLQNHNVPCAVCRSAFRSSVVTIPARNQCHHGWELEYKGYLMASHHAHKGRTEFVCMDENPEADPAGWRDENGVLFYPTEGACGALPCPPYEAGRELTCAVCTK